MSVRSPTPSVAELRAVTQPAELFARNSGEHWAGKLYMRRVSPYLTRPLLRTRISPNAVTWFMMVVGLVTICALMFAISAMALGFGALYPQFETENAAQIPTSFGGLVFMMATITLLGAVIVALWQAVYAYVRAVYVHQPVVVDSGMIFWFAIAAGICAAATAIPLWVGLRKMESFEF